MSSPVRNDDILDYIKKLDGKLDAVISKLDATTPKARTKREKTSEVPWPNFWGWDNAHIMSNELKDQGVEFTVELCADWIKRKALPNEAIVEQISEALKRQTIEKLMRKMSRMNEIESENEKGSNS